MWQALATLGAGALSAGGAALGEKAKDESELLREEPPERKYANSVLQLLSARALSGRKGAADLMEEARLRSEIERKASADQQSILRQYGQMGVESPGMANRLSEIRTGGLTGLINALTNADLERRRTGVAMASRLLGENQPYEREKITEAPMKYKMLSSALPSMGGALGAMGGGKAAKTGDAASDFLAGQKGQSQLGSILPSILSGGGGNTQPNIINKGRATATPGNTIPDLQYERATPGSAIRQPQYSIDKMKLTGLERFNPMQFPYEGA
jgi:hypothetical protein